MGKMTSIARSRLGIGLQDFFLITPREFIFALQDLQELKISENKLYVRTSFEVMRLQTMILVNVNPNVKKHYKDARKFLPFQWDSKIEQTPDEMKGKLLSLVTHFKGTKKGKKKGK